jgi:hypothetical protein
MPTAANAASHEIKQFFAASDRARGFVTGATLPDTAFFAALASRPRHGSRGHP